jgi:hypothetical protein
MTRRPLNGCNGVRASHRHQCHHTSQSQTIYGPACGSASLLLKATDESQTGITIDEFAASSVGEDLVASSAKFYPQGALFQFNDFTFIATRCIRQHRTGTQVDKARRNTAEAMLE